MVLYLQQLDATHTGSLPRPGGHDQNRHRRGGRRIRNAASTRRDHFQDGETIRCTAQTVPSGTLGEVSAGGRLDQLLQEGGQIPRTRQQSPWSKERSQACIHARGRRRFAARNHEGHPPELPSRPMHEALPVPNRKGTTPTKKEVIWCYGPTGSGKSHWAEHNQPRKDRYRLKSYRWWNFYNDQPTILVDEYRTDFCKFHELLSLLDVYEFYAETKEA